MIKTVLIDSNKDDLMILERLLSEHFLNINLCGKADTLAAAARIINECGPDIVFMDVELPLNSGLVLNEYFDGVDYQIILLTNVDKYAMDAINCSACGYLKKPLLKEAVVFAVEKALVKISEKKENMRNRFLAEEYFKLSGNEDVIGIPSLEGLEFIPVRDIICCEGLQKCTRVITKEKTDIISSYNLGVFRKFLEPYGFLSPHKSYLINLHLIRSYHREGTIVMLNGITVPVSKRKKGEFLNHIKHI